MKHYAVALFLIFLNNDFNTSKRGEMRTKNLLGFQAKKLRLVQLNERGQVVVTLGGGGGG